MFVDHLSLLDFRTYAHLDIRLEPGITVFLGPNGVGKTNIVEALDWTADLASHRVSSDGPLIRFGAERAIVRVRVRRGGQQTVLEFELNDGRANRVRINRAAPVRARDALGIVRTVLFSPEDLALVKGDPSHRRRFLDDLAKSMRPVLAGTLADYEKVLRQRNALLRSARSSGRFTATHRSTLAAWNDQFARAGATILHARLQLLDALAPQVATAYGQLTDGSKQTTLRYVSSVLPESAGGDVARLRGFSPADLHQLVLEACESSEQREVERGITLLGPHRDELELLLGEAPARGYASHGETWSYALALRLGSWYVHLADDPSEGAAPILVLDDVFAELDARRRSRLAAIVASAEQVLVTAAVEEDLPAELVAGPHDVVRVGPGTAERADDPAGGQTAGPTAERAGEGPPA
ncbi:DNA replication/repair protein RecF [Kocuria sp.]|uniref:DNA replication/repair protein RecF n=1 Tax=Kocuria sp. TaxID=1871328 RepID=UPI0028114F3F|nr:DNA replication/repair protein RecF [Kocuria sp.]HST71660.1 DNA replication/repair protein RecF [Kocuria rosea]